MREIKQLKRELEVGDKEIWEVVTEMLCILIVWLQQAY
jgi:hypothetical protein